MEPPSPAPHPPAWQWLLLLLPAMEMVLVTAFADAINRQTGGGHEGSLGVMLLNLPLNALFCLAMGWAWARWRLKRRPILQWIYAILALAVNWGVAFAGCAAFIK